MVLRVCGMFDDAVAAYERALELIPESVPALMEMTVCLSEANRATRELFSESAAARLHDACRGLPRILNNLATQALLEGMAQGVPVVDEKIAAAVVHTQPFLEAH